MRRLSGALFLTVLATAPAIAQQPPAKPPAVGVVAVQRKPLIQSTEYVGRIQATDRVNLVARVAAFLEQRLFIEGAEVKKGDLLYRLEQGPFQADLQAKQAAIAQFKAQLQNAVLTLARARALLSTPAGQQSTVDAALANQLALQAQVQGAEAQLAQSQINFDYTEIRAPIDGKIGRSAVTAGNYVTPNSGVLTAIVSQDPMYVVFPVSVRTVIDLRQRYGDKGGFKAIIVRIRLPDGRIYDRTGHLDFVDNSASGNTDTITLRGALPNPLLADGMRGDGTARELVDGELVTVILEDVQPLQALTVPRAAVLSDQVGDYVYVVDADDKAQQRRVQLGQSTPALAAVTTGLSEGENVIVEGIQRARPGQPVSPGPASAQITAPVTSSPAAAGGTAPASGATSAVPRSGGG
jgi:membrane fusion protein (multidrug efflux system)